MDTTYYSSEAIALLKVLVATPSTSRNENGAADVMQQRMESYGLMTHRVKNNVWTICPDYDASRPTILLNAHIDTVKAVSSWTRDPWRTENSTGWAPTTVAAASARCSRPFVS